MGRLEHSTRLTESGQWPGSPYARGCEGPVEPSREIVGLIEVPFLRILRLGLLLGPKLSLKPMLPTILVATDMAAAFPSVSPGSHSAEG